MTTRNEIYSNDHYKVVISDHVLGEDNRYSEHGRPGYAVVNLKTDITEHTTMMLPQALFQADAFAGALSQIDEQAEITETESSIIEDDSVH